VRPPHVLCSRRAGRVLHRKIIWSDPVIDGRATPPLDAQVLQRGIDRDPVDPGAQARLPGEGEEILPQVNEDLLANILTVVGIADTAGADPVDPVLCNDLCEAGLDPWGVAGSSSVRNNVLTINIM
jgi:hypothetical protein